MMRANICGIEAVAENPFWSLSRVEASSANACIDYCPAHGGYPSSTKFDGNNTVGSEGTC